MESSVCCFMYKERARVEIVPFEVERNAMLSSQSGLSPFGSQSGLSPFGVEPIQG